jgi:hypothetical protein
MPSSLCVAAGFLPLLLVCAGCSRVDPFRSIERSVQAELPRVIGPADRYEVRVSRSSSGLIAGRIPWLQIRGYNVRTVKDLELDELAIRLEGVHFSRADRAVREIEQSDFEAQIGASSIAAFLHARRPDLRRVQVRFRDDRIAVKAAPELLGLGVPVEVIGRPVRSGATTINFQASRFSVLHLGLPEFAIRRLEARVNPLVDLTTLSLPVQLTSVRVEGERVIIEGSAVLDTDRLRPPR